MRTLLVSVFMYLLAIAPVQGALTWTPSTTDMPGTVQMHGTAILNGYIYLIGGNASFATPSGDSREVWYAPITGTTDVGPWTKCTGILPPSGDATASNYAYIERAVDVYNGRIYIVGGDWNTATDTNLPTRNSVTILKPQANGDILQADIVETPAVGTTIRFSPGVVINKANGKLYMAGGGSLSAPSAEVNVAQIDPVTGAVGSWSVAGTMTQGVCFTEAKIVGNKMTVLMGYHSGFGGSTVLCQQATLNPDGTLGAFSAVAPYYEDRFDGTAEFLNGKLYYIGGAYGGNTSTRKDVYLATFDGTSTLTGWTKDTDLPVDPGMRRVSSDANASAIFVPGARLDDSAFSTKVFIGVGAASVSDWSLFD